MNSIADLSPTDLKRIPGLYRRWELTEVFEAHRNYQIEDAGTHADGTPLLAIFVSDPPDDITRLRKSHYALDELPETVSFPKHPSEPAREPLPVMQATVDDIAFAIVAAERESSAALGRASALK
eukprot:gene14731-biopygen12551